MTAGSLDAPIERLLPNGIPFLAIPLPGRHSAVVSLWVRCGSRHETAESSGATHLIEHAVPRADPAGGPRGLVERLERLGCQVNALTHREFLVLYAHAPAAVAADCAAYLGRQLAEAPLRDADFESERPLAIEELRRAAADPSAVIHELCYARAFAPDPLALPAGGTPETVGALAPEQVRLLWEQRRHAGTVGVLAAGALDVDRVLDALATSPLADLPRLDWEPGVERAELPPDWSPPQPAAAQYAYVMAGGPTCGYGADDLPAWEVLTTLLGGGAGSALDRALREEHGIAYDAFAVHAPLTGTGLLRIGAGTSPDNADRAEDLLVGELERLAETGWTQEEVTRAQTLTRRRQALEADSLEELAIEGGRALLVGGERRWSPHSGYVGDGAVSASRVRELLAGLVERDLVIARTDD